MDGIGSNVEHAKSHALTLPAGSWAYAGRVSEVDLGFPRTWLEFLDPAEPTRMFRCDATWLSSRWTCIFGAGCRGIYADSPDTGCCTLGAHYADGDDRRRVKHWAGELTPEQWQFHGVAAEIGITGKDEEGAKQTRTVDGACIFLNRPGFAGGAGCALHLLALERGIDPQETKPDVCWQLPIRRDYETREWADGTSAEVVVISEYDRRGWGPGGHDLDWYCSAATEAHISAEPVYVTEQATLERLMGQAAYRELCRLLASGGRPLAHPADPVGPGS